MNNVDFLALLKSRCTKIHFFGLGFVQVKLGDAVRMHFYSPRLPAFVEEPHSHRYNFVSTVITGELTTTVWEVLATPYGENPVTIDYVDCLKADNVELPPSFTFCLASKVNFTTKAGSSYYLDAAAFHQVCPYGPTITLVERGDSFARFAKRIRTTDEPACPFARPMPEDECWAVVAEMLTHAYGENLTLAANVIEKS